MENLESQEEGTWNHKKRMTLDVSYGSSRSSWGPPLHLYLPLGWQEVSRLGGWSNYWPLSHNSQSENTTGGISTSPTNVRKVLMDDCIFRRLCTHFETAKVMTFSSVPWHFSRLNTPKWLPSFRQFFFLLKGQESARKQEGYPKRGHRFLTVVKEAEVRRNNTWKVWECVGWVWDLESCDLHSG
jgi:hypothetical protein